MPTISNDGGGTLGMEDIEFHYAKFAVWELVMEVLLEGGYLGSGCPYYLVFGVVLEDKLEDIFAQSPTHSSYYYPLHLH